MAGGCQEYDSRNNVVRMAFFDANEFPCANKNGVAELRMEYDEEGNLLRVLKFDVSGVALKETSHE